MVSSNNAIYNTIGASISGVTNTLTVTNPSNTASSAARETIVVGGGSAGDPTLNWNVSGVTNWEMGIDNSVNDNLTISQGTALGTNDVWRMDKSGRRTMPLQPCVYAIQSADIPNVTGEGTNYTVLFDSVLFDQASNYNPATGIFTAPITGKYLIMSSLEFYNLSAAVTDITTEINYNAGTKFIISEYGGGNMRNNNNFATCSVNTLLNLTANDTIKIVAVSFGTTKTIGIKGGIGAVRSWLSVMLVC